MQTVLLAAAAAALALPAAHAHAVNPHVFVQNSIKAKIAALIPAAWNHGSSGETLGDYGSYKIELSLRTKSGGAEVHAQCDDGIMVEKGRLEQVLVNLLDNAVEAAAGSPGRREVRLFLRETPTEITVRVADTGPGMPPQVQARAFEAFYTTKDVGQGAGLGLDISRRIIVERHHGQITIESRPGETVLRVQLPCRRENRQ